MLIQIHMLQNYSPANLNRDDTGSPKDAVFGGVRRGRISSQCIKRSIRRSDAFAEAFSDQGLLGVRTRRLPYLIQEELVRQGIKDPELQEIVTRVSQIGRESAKGKDQKEDNADEEKTEAIEEKESQVKQLIFIGRDELKPMAQKLVEIYRRLGSKAWKTTDIGKITKEMGSSLPKSVDIAMFGRMTTSDAFEDVDAAVQVAHAISTNALSEEFDYFTAVDDLANEPGAGMIGDIEFNSSTYYKYLNVHWEELLHNLGGDVAVARKAVLALVEAAATAQPSGKQNTFAAFNLPDFILVEVSSRNLPVSYANAFLKPVKAGREASFMEVSQKQLSDYMEKICGSYNLDAKRAYLSVDGAAMPMAEKKASLKEIDQWLESCLPEEG